MDGLYMTAVQLLTGGGGWPMSVWLTPEKEPFFGGTYFPPRDGERGAARGFLSILLEIADVWARDGERVKAATRSLVDGVRAALAPLGEPAGDTPGPDVVEAAFRGFRAAFDASNGGLRGAPKFPSSLPVRFLLRYHRRARDAGGAPDGDGHAREDGGRRAPRSGRRRIPPLLDRRGLARPALREDAVRQRAPRHRLRRGVAGHRAARPRARRAPDARLPRPRDDLARGGALLGDRRRLGGRGGALLRLERGGAPRAPRRGCRALHALPRGERRGELRGQERAARSAAGRGRVGGARAAARAPVRRAREAPASAPRREDPRRLERPRDLRPRARGARPRGRPSRPGGRSRRGVPARAHGRGRPAAPRVPRRRRERARVPRRPRVRRAGPARPVRGDVRRALARGGGRAVRAARGALRRPAGRGLVRGRRRPRAAPRARASPRTTAPSRPARRSRS